MHRDTHTDTDTDTDTQIQTRTWTPYYLEKAAHKALVGTRQHRKALCVCEEDVRWDDDALDGLSKPALLLLLGADVCSNLQGCVGMKGNSSSG